MLGKLYCLPLHPRAGILKIAILTFSCLAIIIFLSPIHRSNTQNFSPSKSNTSFPYKSSHNIIEELNKRGWKTTLKSVLPYKPKPTNSPDRFKVPNIVHYVWFGYDLDFKFIHYLSFLSVHRYLAPEAIFVHGELGPRGQWWDRVTLDVGNVYHVNRSAPKTAPSGRRFEYAAHASDLVRTQVIFEFGGIYIDADVIILRSFDPLRIYPTVMGRERNNGICNGILVAQPEAPFIKLLLDQYKNYSFATETWAFRSVEYPHLLSLRFPELIHVENTSLQRPSWYELNQIYTDVYNWTGNYAMHLWVRKWYGKLPESVGDLDCWGATLGEIARHVVYGDSEKRSNCPAKIVGGTQTAKLLQSHVTV